MDIPARAEFTGRTTLSTCLHKDGVEHLMSALAGLGVDNVYVDLTGLEMPSWMVLQRHLCF